MSDEFKIAIADVPFGSAYAYRKGDKIAADAVKANKWEDYVASPSTKAAREAQGLPESEQTETTTTAAGGKDK
jgi:hypothetical protein